jgi:predicted GH43/DUF377 family glycosyl hydrolase/ketosteroid isomerase-like protein
MERAVQVQGTTPRSVAEAAHLTVEQVPIDRLHPDPANPRRISEEELESLTRSMRQFGLVQPILARREDATVIGGHQRLVAARRLGLTTVPVIWLDLTTEQARLLNLALNRISGGWDEQLLARLLADLQVEVDLDLTLSGFGEDEIADLIKSLDARERADQPEVFDLETALEEATRAPRSKPGDLWVLGEHRLLCGDATDPAVVARLLGDTRPRLLATDPPYGVSYDPTWRDPICNALGPAEKEGEAMDEHPNVMLARRINEEMKREGPAAMARYVADVVVWHEIGRAEPKHGIADLSADDGVDYEIDCEIHDIVGGAGHVVALINASGRRGGRTLDYRVAEIYHIDDGKITERWAFSDDTAAIAAFEGIGRERVSGGMRQLTHRLETLAPRYRAVHSRAAVEVDGPFVQQRPGTNDPLRRAVDSLLFPREPPPRHRRRPVRSWAVEPNVIPVTRTHVRLRPDARRVVIRPFRPGSHIPSNGHVRARQVIERILVLPEVEVASTLAATRAQFAGRHPDLDGAFRRHYLDIAGLIDDAHRLTEERRLLIGAYFTHEYSIEAAALTNPSIVPAPDQSGLRAGEQRFIVSLRAIGEGHLSSIEFRSGVIASDGRISIDEPSRYTTTGERHDPLYDGRIFRTKLRELSVLNEIAGLVLDPLPAHFSLEQLETAIRDLDAKGVDRAVAFETTRIIHWVAASNYTLTFAEDSHISERVIFPSSPAESQGMEDARFVRFRHDDGAVLYYAVYTAFDGFEILPQLIETADFRTFAIATLNGEAARNKGMALFPRMIDGRYAALSRQDNESNFLVFSDDVRYWHDPYRIQEPERPWELMQLGNCGSPLETEAGWLVITHGVGPLRRYALGAILLDIDDPRRVLGRLEEEPLLVPTEDERDGYVPNVVYSCGSMIHGDDLVIPYGFSDLGSGIAAIPLADILSRLT